MTRPFRFAVQGGPFDDPVALRAYAQLVESLHQTPNFHLFRLDAKIYAAMLADLPPGANLPSEPKR